MADVVNIIVEHAIDEAKRTAAADELTESRSDEMPVRGSLPAALFDAHGPYMTYAFAWSAAYTNEVNRLLPAGGQRPEGALHVLPAEQPLEAPASTSESSRGAYPARRVRLRVAGADDVGAIMGMIRELAEFEREPHAVKTSEATMLRDGFGPRPLFHVMLAELDTDADAGDTSPPPVSGTSSGTGSDAKTGCYTPVAMAFCYCAFSTWEGRVLYLEDLYVKPQHRRGGLSRLLFTALARAAAVAGCARLQWAVLDWNTPAVAAYEGSYIAANKLGEWVMYRLYADGIARLAGLPATLLAS
jgi:GNAT superfamily N-acetyltransferase